MRAPEKTLRTPEEELVSPLTVTVLLAVPDVALFHHREPLCKPALTFAHALPPVSLSVTEGSAVELRLVTERNRTSSVSVLAGIVTVKLVVGLPAGTAEARKATATG